MAAYSRLAKTGKCDSVGGMESERVYSEWCAIGCPLGGLDSFIVVRANMPANGEGRAAFN